MVLLSCGMWTSSLSQTSVLSMHLLATKVRDNFNKIPVYHVERHFNHAGANLLSQQMTNHEKRHQKPSFIALAKSCHYSIMSLKEHCHLDSDYLY